MSDLTTDPQKWANGKKGRPPKLVKHDGMVDEIIENLKEFPNLDMVAAASGISRKTLFNWLARAREVREVRQQDEDARVTPWDDAYIDFLERFEKAELEVKKKYLDRIDDASASGPKYWTAAAWVMERLWPGEFSLKQTVRHEAQVQQDINLTLNVDSPPGIEERRDKIIEAEVIDED